MGVAMITKFTDERLMHVITYDVPKLLGYRDIIVVKRCTSLWKDFFAVIDIYEHKVAKIVICDTLDEVLKVIDQMSCTQGHPEPVIHSSAIKVIDEYSSREELITGSFHAGIPTQWIVSCIKRVFEQ